MQVVFEFLPMNDDYHVQFDDGDVVVTPVTAGRRRHARRRDAIGTAAYLQMTVSKISRRISSPFGVL